MCIYFYIVIYTAYTFNFTDNAAVSNLTQSLSLEFCMVYVQRKQY